LTSPGAFGQHAVAEAGENAKQTASQRAESAFAVDHFVTCHV
jgi:hypothetical protein